MNTPHIGTTNTMSFAQLMQQLSQPRPTPVLPTVAELSAAHAAALQQYGSGRYLITLNRQMGKLETWEVVGAFTKRNKHRGVGVVVLDKALHPKPDYVTFYIHKDVAFMGFPKTKFVPVMLGTTPGDEFKFGTANFRRLEEVAIGTLTDGNTFLLGIDAGEDLEDQYQMGGF